MSNQLLMWGQKTRQGALSNPYQKSIIDNFSANTVAYWTMQKSSLTELDVKNGLTAVFGANTVFKQSGFIPTRKSVRVIKGEKINLKSTALSSKMNYLEGTISLWVDLKNIKNVVAYTNLVYFFINDTNRICINKNPYSPAYEGINVYYRGNGVHVIGGMDYGYKNTMVNITLTYSIAGGYLRMYYDGSKFIESAISSAIVGTTMFYTEVYAPENINYSDMVILNRPVNDAEALILANCKVNVIFEGDSRTTEQKHVWSNVFDLLDKKYKYKVNSVSGSPVVGTASITSRAAAVDAMYIPNMTNIISLLIGVNSSGDDTLKIFNDIKAYCIARRATGYKINLCTEIDSTLAGWTAKSIALNNMFKADTSFYDTLSDLRSDARLQDATNTTYFIDGTHQTLLGEQIIASIIAPKIALLA